MIVQNLSLHYGENSRIVYENKKIGTMNTYFKYVFSIRS